MAYANGIQKQPTKPKFLCTCNTKLVCIFPEIHIKRSHNDECYLVFNLQTSLIVKTPREFTSRILLFCGQLHAWVCCSSRTNLNNHTNIAFCVVATHDFAVLFDSPYQPMLKFCENSLSELCFHIKNIQITLARSSENLAIRQVNYPIIWSPMDGQYSRRFIALARGVAGTNIITSK